MPDDWREELRKERLVKNEKAFRAHNERRAELELAGGVLDEVEVVPFVCECGAASCTAPVEITVADWERIHKKPTHFVVCQGHQLPEIERVIDEHGDYLVVEKFRVP